MQKIIMARGRGGRRLAFLGYKCGGGAEPPRSSLLRLPAARFFSFFVLLPWRRRGGFQRPIRGRLPRRGMSLRLPSEVAVVPERISWLLRRPLGGTDVHPPRAGTPLGAPRWHLFSRQGHQLRSSPHDEGRHSVIVRPPRLHFSSLGVLPEFVVWSESLAGTSLWLPCFFSGELSSSGLDGLWL